ncbi:MAG: flagellar assembly protein FliW [Deltaproteobacteria bacterium]
MKLQTRDFGQIDIEEEKVIVMPFGMPGFPDAKRFVILDRKEIRPFLWYQCVDDPELAFVIINPNLFKPDYVVDLKAALREMSWKNQGEEDLAVYAIVNASEGVPEKITANLIGPIVINTRKKEATQMVISGSPYSHKQSVFHAFGTG